MVELPVLNIMFPFLALIVSSRPVHRADLYLHIAFLVEKFVIAVGTWGLGHSWSMSHQRMIWLVTQWVGIQEILGDSGWRLPPETRLLLGLTSLCGQERVPCTGRKQTVL